MTQLLHHAPFGVLALDESGMVVDANEIGCALLNKTHGSLQGQLLMTLFPDAAAKVIRALLVEAIETGAAQSDADLAYTAAPYSWQYFRLSITRQDSDSYIVVLNDTTETRRAKEQLENFKLELEEQVLLRTEELETKNKELSQFAYIASHDLQEPLRTMRSFVDLLQDELGEGTSEDSKQYLSFIGQSSKRMSALVQGLMEYSRIGSNRQTERVDCNALIADVRADLATIISESQAHIEASILPHLDAYGPELRALFQNLILNAIKFRQPGRAPLVTIEAKRQQQYWQFSIQDNGIGIAEEHQERIFVIYQRVHPRQEYEGDGIGLAHCQKIVELHGGRIWLSSVPGAGSCFYFTVQNQSVGTSTCPQP